jgi:hypothetical protein
MSQLLFRLGAMSRVGECRRSPAMCAAPQSTSIAEIGEDAVVVGKLEPVARGDAQQLTVCGMPHGAKPGPS